MTLIVSLNGVSLTQDFLSLSAPIAIIMLTFTHLFNQRLTELCTIIISTFVFDLYKHSLPVY